MHAASRTRGQSRHHRHRRRHAARQAARWTAVVAIGIGLLAGIAIAVVYFTSEAILDSRYDVRLRSAALPLVLPTSAEAIAEGQRLARIRGCLGGCHGRELEGAVHFEESGVVRIVAPSLTRAVREHGDAELERVIRHGVRADGSSTFGMPSDAFSELSDEDLARILAFLRQARPGAGPEHAREMTVWPVGRLRVLTGAVMPTAQAIVHETVQPPARTPDDAMALGRYLARTICSECHGHDMRGGAGGGPGLLVVTTYPADALARLLRTGEAVGNRKLDRMRQLAAARYVHLTDTEISALDLYLRARAADLAIAGGS